MVVAPVGTVISKGIDKVSVGKGSLPFNNDKEYFSKKANEYWQDVDLYIGGDEHATGHLI